MGTNKKVRSTWFKALLQLSNSLNTRCLCLKKIKLKNVKKNLLCGNHWRFFQEAEGRVSWTLVEKISLPDFNLSGVNKHFFLWLLALKNDATNKG